MIQNTGLEDKTEICENRKYTIKLKKYDILLYYMAQINYKIKNIYTMQNILCTIKYEIFTINLT